MKQIFRPLLAASFFVGLVANAHAVTDPTGDFLPSFTGTPSAALDITSADVTLDPTSNRFVLQATTAGPIAGASGAAYVFGFNTGGTVSKPFAAIGEPNVAFNNTVVLKADGTGAFGAIPVTTRVVGDEIFATVSASLLPSHGLADADYTWSLWSIDSSITGLSRNADFAPDGDIRVSAVPEPANMALLIAGLGLVGFVSGRRTKLTLA